MTKYKVWTKRPRIFEDLQSACEYANAYFKKSGIIVAVTEIKGRKSNEH